MIPLRDVIPSRTTPWVTLLLIVLNAGVFIYELALTGDARARFIVAYGLVPADVSWIAPVTSMFLHSGWLHIASNLLALWLFGDNVEDRMGHGRFLAFYGLAGLAAALTSTGMSQDAHVPFIGASGAVAGVIGAYFTLFPTSRVLVLLPFLVFVDVVEIPAVFFLAFWFVMQATADLGRLAGAPASGVIVFWAIGAGFLTGLLTVRLFRRPERQRVEWWS